MKNIFIFIIALFATNFVTNDAQAQKKKLTDREIFANAYILKDSEKIIAEGEPYMLNDITPTVYSIERFKDSTKVTFLQPLYYDSQWVHYGRGYSLVDTKTGTEYPVIDYANGLPMGRLLIVRGCNNKSIFISLIFPPLPQSVKTIDIKHTPSDCDQIPSNSAPRTKVRYNFRLKDYDIKSINKLKAKGVRLKDYK